MRQQRGPASLVLKCRGPFPEAQECRDEYVFVYRGRPIETMHNTGRQEARKRVQLPHVRVHDLKHTFGRRLRAAGVSFEDRQDLLGHRAGRITTHYSAAELANLIEAANKAWDGGPANS